MPFERQTLTGIRDDVLQDMADAEIYDTTTGQLAAVTMFLDSPLECVGYGTAGGVYCAYGYLDIIAVESTPWGATDENAVGWGSLKGVTRKPATPAAGSETVSGPVETDIPRVHHAESAGRIFLSDRGRRHHRQRRHGRHHLPSDGGRSRRKRSSWHDAAIRQPDRRVVQHRHGQRNQRRR